MEELFLKNSERDIAHSVFFVGNSLLQHHWDQANKIKLHGSSFQSVKSPADFYYEAYGQGQLGNKCNKNIDFEESAKI